MYCMQCGAQCESAEANCPNCGAPPTPIAVARRRRKGRRTAVLVALGVLTPVLLLCNALNVILTVPDLVGLVLSLLGATIPAALYTGLVLSVDRYEREPWRIVFGALAWGALVATLFSGIFNVINAAVLGQVFATVIGAPLVEESFKGIALLGLLLMFRREFDNVLDGLIYGALIGMGFELMEDVLYLGSAYVEGGVAGFGEEWVLRPVLTGSAHALFTGTTGAAIGWARSQYQRGWLRFLVPVVGWMFAVLQHFLWNIGGAVLAVGLGTDVPGLIRLALQILVLILPAALVLYLVARLARRRERNIIREQLSEEVARGVLSQEEYALLSDDAARRRALASAKRERGRAGRRAQREFFQAAAELAFRKHHHSQGERLDGELGTDTEDLYRAQLAATRARLASHSSLPVPQ